MKRKPGIGAGLEHPDEESTTSTTHDLSTNGSRSTRAADPGDVFNNLDAIKLTPEEAGLVGAKEALVTLAIRKPNRAEFVRIDPNPAMSIVTAIYIDVLKEVYFVTPEARSIFPDGLKPIQLFTAVNQRGLPFLWPVAIEEGVGGRRNNWNDSARAAAELAKTTWIRLVADMTAGGYRVYEALGKLPDPVFPERPLADLLRIAFRGRVADNENHLIARQALGLIP